MSKRQYKILNESIRTLWRFAFVRLYDEMGEIVTDYNLSTSDGEYKKLFWRFYWLERKW